MPKKITEEQIDLIIERLNNRVEKANTLFLRSIGSSIKKIKKLTPTQAQQLIQIFKYGGEYDEIVKKITKYTNLNINEIDEIFSNYAKKDQHFYKQFYDYRNKPFIHYEENVALQRQTQALANIVKNEMYNFTRSNVLGYTIRNLQGKPIFLGLRETYNKALDEALLNVGQGKETFDQAMTKILKDIGGSGLKTIEYQSGRSMRLDSAIRMHLKERLRELHNENQKLFGDEFEADGVEISVHLNPAVDHAEVQGRQFSNKEYDKLQRDGIATTYDGIEIDLHRKLKSGESSIDFRPISMYNCYHTMFPIILSVNESEYSNEQLQQIIDDNNKGFEYEGKHYSLYEGEQLMRNLEKKVREQKDIQILAKSSDNKEILNESQQKITQLTNKYHELSKISGLSTKMKRMRVSGYRRTKVK